MRHAGDEKKRGQSQIAPELLKEWRAHGLETALKREETSL